MNEIQHKNIKTIFFRGIRLCLFSYSLWCYSPLLQKKTRNEQTFEYDRNGYSSTRFWIFFFSNYRWYCMQNRLNVYSSFNYLLVATETWEYCSNLNLKRCKRRYNHKYLHVSAYWFFCIHAQIYLNSLLRKFSKVVSHFTFICRYLYNKEFQT